MQPGKAITDEAALRLGVEGTASETGVEFFRALNAVSYPGVPLPDIDGEVIGHLSVLDP